MNNTLQTTLRVSLASFLGAMIGLSIGKELIGNGPLALICSTAVGAITGFILFKPKEFFSTLFKMIGEETQKLKKEIKKDWKLRSVYRIHKREAFWEATRVTTNGVSKLLSVFTSFFIACVLLFGVPGLPKLLPATYIAMFAIVLSVIFLIVFFWTRNETYTLLREYTHNHAELDLLDNPEYLQHLKRRAQEDVKVRRDDVLAEYKSIGRGIRRVFKTIFYLITHLFIFRCIFLAIAKTCQKVASLGRMCSMIGAAFGCIIGFVSEMNILLGMISGALVGGSIVLSTMLLLKVLPDPNKSWPQLPEFE